MAEEAEKVEVKTEEQEQEQEQEVTIELEEESPKEEPVEEVSAKEEPVEEESPKEEDELDSYSKGVQNRIKKLTEKYRQEERDKAEAVRLSQQLIEENKKLKTRVQSLDTGYLNEYNNRLESQSITAKQMYKEAYEAGDADKMVEAQELLSKIAVEKQKYESAKAKVAQEANVQTQKKEPTPQPQVAPQQQPKPDPRAQNWAEKNTWFGEDRIMQYINSLSKKKGLTRRAMSTILKLIAVFETSFHTSFKRLRNRVEHRSPLLLLQHPAVPQNQGAGRSS